MTLTIKSMLFSIAFASAGFMAQSAQAATPPGSQALDTVSFSDGMGGFTAVFAGIYNNTTPVGTPFDNKFTFSVDSRFDSSAPLTSTYLRTKRGFNDLLIQQFNLVAYDPVTLALGTTIYGTNNTSPLPHSDDTWSLKGVYLKQGSYFLEVQGLVLGSTGGSYSGNLVVAAVPEPETYGMLLGGLGLIGFLARRKAAKKAA